MNKKTRKIECKFCIEVKSVHFKTDDDIQKNNNEFIVPHTTCTIPASPKSNGLSQ